MVRKICCLLKKEFSVEYAGNRTFIQIISLSAISVFIASYIPVISGFRPDYSLIFWITVFFTVFSGLDKIFRYETDRNNMKFCLQYYSCEEIVTAKFIFNVMAVMFTETVIFLICCFFNNFTFVSASGSFVLIIISSISISASTVFSALISSKTNTGFLFSISALPVIFPLLLIFFRIDVFSFSEVFTKNLFLILLLGVFYFIVALKLSPFIIKED
ncbi:MAG: hypothetical protein JW982_15425 [Spirochaetes bacterium]|nr:hypothetical protein [Spirochaetota bacterium]